LKEYKRSHRKDEWTTQETQLLRDLYPSTNYILEEIRKKLPNRTPNAIRLKASRLGLRRPIPTEKSQGCCSHCGQTSEEATS